tara:strand:- start:1263 stop:1667 length:405 start_codon:yes stop_codon:yes gene_type:complete
MFSKILNLFNINNDSKLVVKKNDIVNHNIQPINDANFQPESHKNNELINNDNIMKNWQYRKYMTDNATSIREFNYFDSANSINYLNRPNNSPVINSNEFISEPILNNISVRNDSDLKNNFLNKQNMGQNVQEIK